MERIYKVNKLKIYKIKPKIKLKNLKSFNFFLIKNN